MNIVIKWPINPNDLCSIIPDVLGYQSMMTSLMSTYMMSIWWSKARSMWSNKPQVFAPDDIRDVYYPHIHLFTGKPESWVQFSFESRVFRPPPSKPKEVLAGANWEIEIIIFVSSYKSRLIPFDCSSSYQLTLIIDDCSIHWTSSSSSLMKTALCCRA